MRNILFILSALLIFISISCEKKSEWIKGDVSSYTDTVWNVSEKFGEVIKDNISSVTKVIFNEDGNVTEIIEYDSEGDIKEKTIQKYDGKKLTDKFCYDEEGEQTFHFEYFFEKDKLIKLISTCTMSSPWVTTEYFYYSKSNPDRLDSITEISEQGKDLTTFKYLDNNNSYHEYVKFWTGNSMERIYYFDKDKRLIKEVFDGTTTYTYNKDGFLETMKNSKGETYEYEYECDSKGSVIKVITYITTKTEMKKAESMVTRYLDYK